MLSLPASNLLPICAVQLRLLLLLLLLSILTATTCALDLTLAFPVRGHPGRLGRTRLGLRQLFGEFQSLGPSGGLGLGLWCRLGGRRSYTALMVDSVQFLAELLHLFLNSALHEQLVIIEIGAQRTHPAVLLAPEALLVIGHRGRREIHGPRLTPSERVLRICFGRRRLAWLPSRRRRCRSSAPRRTRGSTRRLSCASAGSTAASGPIDLARTLLLSKVPNQ
mmetsp:Transcript_91916/g.205374  ORF Transcript_91916/g.205374 Transcript_91916/m.205374 type:complete len:222 (-) Transcript_91916:1087-1752(-)